MSLGLVCVAKADVLGFGFICIIKLLEAVVVFAVMKEPCSGPKASGIHVFSLFFLILSLPPSLCREKGPAQGTPRPHLPPATTNDPAEPRAAGDPRHHPRTAQTSLNLSNSLNPQAWGCRGVGCAALRPRGAQLPASHAHAHAHARVCPQVSGS